MASYRRSLVVSVLFTLCCGPGIVLGLGPWLLTGFQAPAGEPLFQRLLAGALIAAGLMPLFESIVRFIAVGRGTLMPAVPTEALVVTGLYQYVRNPMYLGVLTALAGEAVLLWTRGMWAYIAAVWLGMHLFVRFYEEPRLSRTYAGQYREYQSHVPRWFPHATRWRPGWSHTPE